MSDVVADDELLAAAGRLAEQIARDPRRALIRTKAKAIARAGISPGLSTLDF